MIPLYSWPSQEALNKIRPRDCNDDVLREQVAAIVQDVKLRGDQALLEYTAAFDGCSLTPETLRVGGEELALAYQKVGEPFLRALREAKKNILQFHQRQKRQDWFTQDGNGSLVGQVYRPLDRVGIYVPGGTASYPSSVLMTALPAVVAGVPEIVMVTPAGKEGSVPAATLAAAGEAGVTEIYRIGGAQAIAALAFGTQMIRRVDKIVGPGNIYVTLAKKMVFGTVGIDMLAGPSEILIIGDGTADAAFAAADLLSQAEHDSRARAILVTCNKAWADEVCAQLEKQIVRLPRQTMAAEALEKNGAVVLVKDLEEAFEVANLMAPEHLELLLASPLDNLIKVRHAGAVFLGPYSPEPVGDYWAGPNHVLPTGGAARYASPLTVDDYCKRSSIIQYTRPGLEQAEGSIRLLTETEGLTAHGAAVAARGNAARGNKEVK